MILVHTCCTTCALNLLKSIEAKKKLSSKDLLLYYYNPNIHPESEWHERRKALQQTMDKYGYKVIIDNWSPKDYFKMIKKLKQSGIDEENKDLRCPHCYELRLRAAFEKAASLDISMVTSTMLTSAHMDKEMIGKIGKVLSKEYEKEFVIPKNITCGLDCSKYGYYMQNYCGCVYSLKEKVAEKYL